MVTDWTFLEPWCTSLRASFVPKVPTDSSNEMQVSFNCPFRDCSQRVLSFMIDLEAEIQKNVLKLIQIQEAIELFTVLSNVDNKAFQERFQPVTQWTTEDNRRWYPSWRLDIRGSATLQQATWSSLFKSSDTSPQFQRAIEKLKMMELEDTSKDYLSGLDDIRIGWACKFDGADVKMDVVLNVLNNDIFKTGLQRLFKAGGPLVKQLGLTGDPATLVDWWRNQSEADGEKVPMDITLSITIRDFTTTYSRILTGLAWLPIRSLEMFFNKGKGTTEMRAQVYSNRDYPVLCYKFMLKSDIISNSLLAAIYSFQAMRSDTDPIWIYVDLVDSESWPLVMRLICCGPAVGISLAVRAVHVTNSDLLKIADVTDLHCRIGNDVSEISHDTEGRNLQVSSEFSRLELGFTDIESGTLVINLLGLIGRNLRSLTVIVVYSFDMTLDLSQLSAACPNLEYLLTRRIHVVVSDHNEALRLWPIQDLRLDSYSQLSDLALCLRNPTLRMTHELKSIRIREFRREECNDTLKRDLLIHDGDFLSNRKEKVPIRSKAAMISAVSCARKTKAVHRLHEDVLGLIFVFASTPATRSVCFWTKGS